MRIVEFASASEQLALWKLVSDNVWAAINKQAKEEAEAKALKRAQSKAAVRGKTVASPKHPYALPPKPLPKPKLVAKTNKPQPKFTQPVKSIAPINRATEPLDAQNYGMNAQDNLVK